MKSLGSLPENTSHNYRMYQPLRFTEWLRLEKTSGGHLVKLPCSKPTCPKPCPDGFYMFPRMKTPKPP